MRQTCEGNKHLRQPLTDAIRHLELRWLSLVHLKSGGNAAAKPLKPCCATLRPAVAQPRRKAPEALAPRRRAWMMDAKNVSPAPTESSTCGCRTAGSKMLLPDAVSSTKAPSLPQVQNQSPPQALLSRGVPCACRALRKRTAKCPSFHASKSSSSATSP